MRAHARPRRAPEGDGLAGHRARNAWRVVALAALLAGAGMAGGCEPRPGQPAAPPRPAEPTPGTTGPGASRPAPGAAGPRIDPRCVVPFPEDGCPPAVGFPAISADGRRVMVIDRGPDTGWGGLLLTVRVVAAPHDEGGDTGQAGAVVAQWPVVTAEDHERWATDDDGAFVPAFSRVLSERLAPVEAALSGGGFRPLTDLGAIHPGAPGEPVQGMRAWFDITVHGARDEPKQDRRAAYPRGVLLVTDVQTGAVLWKRAFGPSRSWRPDPAEPGRVCGPFPVGEIHVWASREPSMSPSGGGRAGGEQPAGEADKIAVAQVTYVGSDLCPTERPYFILR